MAKMIPNWIDDAPLSERRVFDLLKNDPDTADWTVLHSLLLSNGGEKPFGEIDFVAIIPGEGIVCLEVKGGGISVREGVWYSVDWFGQTHTIKNPFAQAQGSMFALRDYIRNSGALKHQTRRCPIGCMAVFPGCECPPPTPEFKRWEAIDRDDIEASISESIMRFAHQRLRHSQPHGKSRLPSVSQAKAIRNLLRPDFDRPLINLVAHAENQIEKLTAEQYTTLDLLADNDRCMFSGVAGTGKTLLAIEYAHRAAREGDRVLLVCFNRLLAGHLKSATGDMKNITAGNWHEVARDFILGSSLEDEFRQAEEYAKMTSGWDNLFQKQYLDFADLAIGEYVDNRGEPFDVLVMDEAQDLLANRRQMEFLDKALAGGLAGGRWAIFGDAKQTLFGEPVDQPGEMAEYCANFVKFRLNFNFRNAKPIVDEIDKITGRADQSFRTGVGDGPPVKRIYWKNAGNLAKRLEGEVTRLTDMGISPKDIVILSPKKLGTSDISDMESVAGLRMADITDFESDPVPIGDREIAFSTIQAFKGMEQKAVIIVGIDAVDNDWMRTTLYVGMSRARTSLTLMIHDDARKEVQALLAAGN